jgi:hypothetical protein
MRGPGERETGFACLSLLLKKLSLKGNLDSSQWWVQIEFNAIVLLTFESGIRCYSRFRIRVGVRSRTVFNSFSNVNVHKTRI